MLDWLWNKESTRNINAGHSLTGTDILHLGGNSHSSAGLVVNEKTALNVVAVRSCIDVIARTVASLSLHLYRRKGDDRNRATDHRLYKMLHDEPNSEMTSCTWLESMLNRVLLYGNSFDFIDRQDGEIVGIYPLGNDKVKPHRTNGQLKYRVKIGDQTRDLEPSDILHVLGFSLDGVIGLSPIEHAANTIGVSLAQDKTAAKSFENGMQLNGLLVHPERLSPDARKSLREQISSTHRGVDNAFRFLILQEGMKFEPLTMTSSEAQFVEHRLASLRDVCRVFHVPPHMVGDLEGGASFASIEQQAISYYKDTIKPWLTKLEKEFNRKLLKETEKPRLYFEFDVASLLRGDQQSQDESFSKGLQFGWYSINDVRRKKNLPVIEGGDEHYRPVNMQLVSMDNEPEPPAPEPEEAPEEPRADLTPLWRDALSRVITKEVNAIKRAEKKYNGEEFTNWLECFYEEHGEHVCNTVGQPDVTQGSPGRPDWPQRRCGGSFQYRG